MKNKFIKTLIFCLIFMVFSTGCSGVGLSDNVEIKNDSLQEVDYGYVYTAQVKNNNSVNVSVSYDVVVFDSNGTQVGNRLILEDILANTTANVGCAFTIAPGSISRYEIANFRVQYDW